MESICEYKLYRGGWVTLDSPHLSTPLTPKEVMDILAGGGYFIRNISNWDKQSPTQYWYVIKDNFGGIEELPSKVRNQVRRSLKTYDFRRVTNAEMIELGYECFNRSREKFGGGCLLVTKDNWKRRVEAVNQEHWLGFDRETGKAASFAMNIIGKDYCDYRTMGVSPVFPNSTYPMYGLIYEMNRYYLEESSLKFVMDGARSITEHSNIQPFLEDKFKFRKAYCDLQIFYNRWIGAAVKLLFPFRKLIKHPKVAAILRQEAWARGLEG